MTTWIEWGYFNPAGTFSRAGCGFGAAAPADAAVYRSAGRLRAGSGRANENVEAVEVLTIDDVGSRIDAGGMALLAPEPTDILETSPGNFQWQYVIGGGGMAPAAYVALRSAMKANALWGPSHATAPSNLIRVAMGVNGKPGVAKGWKVVRVGGSGREWDAEALARAFVGTVGAAPAPSVPPGDLLAPSEALLKAVLARLPNDGVAGYCSTYEAWIEFGLALYGATGGEGLELWEDWCSTQLQQVDETAKWASFSATGLGWDTLCMYEDTMGTGSRSAIAALVFDDGEAPPAPGATTDVTMFTREDFRSVVGEVDFVHVGTGAFWKVASVDAKVAPVVVGVKDDGSDRTIRATAWMRAHRYVTELSWLPGRERIVANASIGVMGLERRPLHSVFNLYQAPPVVTVVGEVNAEPWCDLVRRLWPDEANEIFDWFGHRVQRPGEKCNHALVLGGAPGIGKDTVLEAVRRAVGVANCNEIMPSDLRTGFNDYVKSVLLVINELRDDGQLTQYAIYDKSKTLIAAPPYVVSINSKYLKRYTVPNVCGVVMTSNYKETGLYLPADDRRHLVCWSEAEALSEGDVGFAALWQWLEGGGFAHVAAWLQARDLSGFDPKAPPRKTRAFLDIVEAGGSNEEKALGDKLDRLGRPKIMRIQDLKIGAGDVFSNDGEMQGLSAWLGDNKYRKVVAEALGRAGYRKIRNPDSTTRGRWKIEGRDEYLYGRKDVNEQELRGLARKMAETLAGKGGKA